MWRRRPGAFPDSRKRKLVKLVQETQTYYTQSYTSRPKVSTLFHAPQVIPIVPRVTHIPLALPTRMFCTVVHLGVILVSTDGAVYPYNALDTVIP